LRIRGSPISLLSFDTKPFTVEGNRFYQRGGRLYAKVFLLFNKKEFKGLKYKIPSGPNIIVTNHPSAVKEMIGPVRDVAIIYSVYDTPPNRRQVSFLAHSEIFTKKEFVETISIHLHPILQKILNPIIRLFVRYAIPRIKALGTIPVYNTELGGRRETREKIKEYLLEGRAIVFLQSNILHQSEIHPYLQKFRKGAAFFAYDLYRKYKINIPVTPISIYGTEGFIRPLKKIRVNIGRSMSIKAFLRAKSPVKSFTDALEERVKDLLEESRKLSQVLSIGPKSNS
jgi:1-acyl-sn-glycerol-3-phosphate acyltransferase